MPSSILPIITREQLRNLNLDNKHTTPKDLAAYERIDSFVNSIYRRVLDIAENTTDTEYIHRLLSEYDVFYLDYLDIILQSLALRLPDCEIGKKTMIHDSQGNLKEVTNLSFNEYPKHLYILINWS